MMADAKLLALEATAEGKVPLVSVLPSSCHARVSVEKTSVRTTL